MRAPDGYMMVKEAAASVGCSPVTINGYCLSGIIEYRRVGLRQIVIPVSEVERIKNGQLYESRRQASQ